jgi:hypothetical protein
MPKRRFGDDEDLLRELAALCPRAQELVEQLRARHRPGRKPISKANFRQLELLWKSFRRQNRELEEAAAAKRFLRIRGEQVEKLLKIKRGRRGTVKGQLGSLRNAIGVGAKESARVNELRRSRWQILPAGLFGRQIVTDPNEAILRRYAMRLALLGES